MGGQATQMPFGYCLDEFSAVPDLRPPFIAEGGLAPNPSEQGRARCIGFDPTKKLSNKRMNFGSGEPMLNPAGVDMWGLPLNMAYSYFKYPTPAGNVQVPVGPPRSAAAFLPSANQLYIATDTIPTRFQGKPLRFFP